MLICTVVALAALTSCQSTSATIPPRIELSTLFAAPETFNGKEVVVSGLVFIEEGRYMVLPAPAAAARRELMYITLDSRLQRSADELAQKYLKWRGTYLVATLRGRFVMATEFGFGHQNAARFKLEVSRVIAVESYKAR